jgi:hypothetical protein
MKKFKFFDTEEETCDLSKPSKEEYEKSLKECEYFAGCLKLSRARRDELLDALCEERSAEKTYLEMYEKHRDIIRKYEIYEELEARC